MYIKAHYYFSSDHRPENKKINIRACQCKQKEKEKKCNVREEKRARGEGKVETMKKFPIVKSGKTSISDHKKGIQSESISGHKSSQPKCSSRDPCKCRETQLCSPASTCLLEYVLLTHMHHAYKIVIFYLGKSISFSIMQNLTPK